MEVDPKRRPYVVLRSFAELRKQEPANDNRFESTAPLKEGTAEKVAQVGDPKPRFGGLHQLAVPEDGVATAEPDFSKYRVGFNNRTLLGAIVKDLNQRFGTSLSYGFSSELEAFAHAAVTGAMGFGAGGGRGFSIGEKAIDALVEPYELGIKTRAIATFAVAHELSTVCCATRRSSRPVFRRRAVGA